MGGEKECGTRRTGWRLPRRSPPASERAKAGGRHGNSRGPENDSFVQAAGAIALQIERDVLVADGFDRADDRRPPFLVERARHFIAPDLDAREGVMVTHAADAQTKIAN